MSDAKPGFWSFSRIDAAVSCAVRLRDVAIQGKAHCCDAAGKSDGYECGGMARPIG